MAGDDHTGTLLVNEQLRNLVPSKSLRTKTQVLIMLTRLTTYAGSAESDGHRQCSAWRVSA